MSGHLMCDPPSEGLRRPRLWLTTEQGGASGPPVGWPRRRLWFAQRSAKRRPNLGAARDSPTVAGLAQPVTTAPPAPPGLAGTGPARTGPEDHHRLLQRPIRGLPPPHKKPRTKRLRLPRRRQPPPPHSVGLRSSTRRATSTDHRDAPFTPKSPESRRARRFAPMVDERAPRVRGLVIGLSAHGDQERPRMHSALHYSRYREHLARIRRQLRWWGQWRCPEGWPSLATCPSRR